MTILQTTVIIPDNLSRDYNVWMDIMEFPETITDFTGVLKKAKQDFPNRKVRLIKIEKE